ncbi:response regulator [Novosphingobium sp. 9]|uniref:response regulator n=1 Tax=Novosphingobium sp. 9 TaxID=2025349 RepID=UPI0021B6BC60|nr:response regulator [Novosphingobium sp. 9]
MGQALQRAILIVEDEPLIRHDLMDFFEDHGFRVLEAGNADEAIGVLNNNSAIQIVLTDVQMPGSMDGIRLAHFIRDRYPPTILIVASGAVKSNMADLPDHSMFVTKPFDPRAVLRQIERMSARN